MTNKLTPTMIYTAINNRIRSGHIYHLERIFHGHGKVEITIGPYQCAISSDKSPRYAVYLYHKKQKSHNEYLFRHASAAISFLKDYIGYSHLKKLISPW